MLAALCLADFARADEVGDLIADRIAVERVYYSHRTGTKPPFEEVLPHGLAAKLVQQDLHKEIVLKKVYGIEISREQMDAEIARINSSTRAPEMLGELKAALGNDPSRFARTIVRPLLVERELRRRFENDDRLHAAQRKKVELLRLKLLSDREHGASLADLLSRLKAGNEQSVSESTWQLGERPPGAADDRDSEIKKRFGPDARLLSAPADTRDEFYSSDLPPELQRVLSTQLNRAGDISAVIETPQGFQLYVLERRTTNLLCAAAMTIPKRSYDEWLNQSEQKDR